MAPFPAGPGGRPVRLARPGGPDWQEAKRAAQAAPFSLMGETLA